MPSTATCSIASSPNFAEELSGIDSVAPDVPFVSTVTGSIEPSLAFDAEYWWRNIREPVRLDAALDSFDALGIGTLLEIGPHPVLQFFLREAQRKSGQPIRVLASLARGQMSGDPVQGILAACHVAGHDISSGPLFDGARSTRGLPFYPFQRQTTLPTTSRESLDVMRVAQVHPLLGFPVCGDELTWRAQIDTTLLPWLADHTVDGDVIVPATALIDMALAAARQRFPGTSVIDLLDVEFRQPLLLEASAMVEVELRIITERNTFEILSRPRLSDAPRSVHVTGRVAVGDLVQLEREPHLTSGTPMDSASLYACASGVGLGYGPAFQTVAGVTLHDRRSATVLLHDPDAAYRSRAAAGSVLDPAWTDGAMQGLVGLLSQQIGAETGLMLPRRFGRVRCFGPPSATPRAAHLTLVRAGPRAVEAQIHLVDADGEPIADMSGVWFVRVPLRRQREAPPLWVTELQPLAPLHQPMSRLRSPLTGPSAAPAGMPQDAAILLDACISSAAYAALVPLAPEPELDADTLVATGVIHPAAKRLVQHMIEWLVADGLASREGGASRLAGRCDLPPAAEIWRSLLGDLPQISGELALLAAAIESLPRAFVEGPRPAAVLSPAMFEQVLEDGPDGHATITAVAARVAGIANACPTDRPLRILEVGARGAALARTDWSSNRVASSRVALHDRRNDSRGSRHCRCCTWPHARARHRLGSRWRPAFGHR